jgi:cell division protein FtsZ
VQDLLIKNPTIVVGIGGAGSRITMDADEKLHCENILLSSDKKDLSTRGKDIHIGTGAWANPSTYKLRYLAQNQSDRIMAAIAGHPTVIIVANLAGRSGCAMAPIVSKLAKESGATVICVAIMPFKFEKDRIFAAGLAFRRLRDTCDSVVVMDNDAFLDNNPELTKEECYSLTNRAIVDVLGSILTGGIKNELNVLCTSKPSADSATSLRDSVSMLYQNVPDPAAVRRTVLYVTGGDKVPIGDLNRIVGHMQGMFKLDSATEVAVSSVAASDGVKVHLMASAHQKTRFDRYDPLGEVFPKESVLDWDEPESAAELALPIPTME